MRNYIIFYTAIIVFVIGGIKWTSYVIEKDNNEKLEKTNYHKQITDLIVSGGEVSAAETLNKNIVLYLWRLSRNNNNNQSDFLKFNELNNKYSANTAFYVLSRTDRDFSESFFQRIKLKPDFKIVDKPRELTDYVQSLSNYFYDKEALDTMANRSPAVIVISNAGKIKLYKIGTEKDLMAQIEKAIQ